MEILSTLLDTLLCIYFSSKREVVLSALYLGEGEIWRFPFYFFFSIQVMSYERQIQYNYLFSCYDYLKNLMLGAV